MVLVLGGLSQLFGTKKFVASIIRKLYHVRGYPEVTKLRSEKGPTKHLCPCFISQKNWD
jgi:hypothetical protein